MKSTIALIGMAQAGFHDTLSGNMELYKLTTETQSHGDDVWNLRSVNDHKADSDTQIDFGNVATGRANARPPLQSNLMTMAEALEIVEEKHNPKSSGKKSNKVAKPAAKKAAKKPVAKKAAAKKAPAKKAAAKKAPAKKAGKLHKKQALAQESDSDDDDDEDDVQLADDEEVDHSGEFFKVTEAGKLGAGGYERVTTPRFAADSDDIFMRSMVEQYALEGKNKDGSPNGQFWMDEAGARSAASEVLHTHRNLVAAPRADYLKTYFPRSWAHFDVNRTGKIEAIKMPQLIRFLCSDQQMYLW
jgi:hypothetical protein